MRTNIKGELKAEEKNGLKWTFTFSKVTHTAWQWQFRSNKYDVWRFNL